MMDKIGLAVALLQVIIKAVSDFLEVPESEIKKSLLKKATIDDKTDEVAKEIDSCLPEGK